jgi:hypothetical protein
LQVQVNLTLDPSMLPVLLALQNPAHSARLLKATQALQSAPSTGEPSSSGAPAGSSAPAAVALNDITQQLSTGLTADEIDMEAYMDECKGQHMYTFLSPCPEQGVSVSLPDGRAVLVPRATQDGGCIPSIMSQKFADSIGVSYKHFAETEGPRVRTIEGAQPTSIIGHTSPLSVILAKGAAGEVTLQAPRGFLVVKGDAAAEMYDVVLGRDLLARVSGFVVPLARQFMYIPGMQRGDFTLRSLPIAVGRSKPPSYMADVAAASAAPDYLICAAMVQAEEGPQPSSCSAAGGQTSGSSSAAEPCCSTPEAVDGAEQHAALPESMSLLCLLLLFSMLLLGMQALRWLAGRAAGNIVSALRKAAAAVSTAAVQERPYQPQGQGKLYWRTGQFHRASDGERIKLQCAPGSSGNKPRVVEVLQRQYTLRFLATAVPARALLLMLMLLTCAISTTVAMQTTGGFASTSLVARDALRVPLSPPYTANTVLMMGLTGSTGADFRLSA